MIISVRADKSTSETFLNICASKATRYLRVGYLLHFMTLAGIAMAVIFFQLAQKAYSDQSLFSFLFHAYLTAYGASLPFFSQLDARSRYQNYKLMKDKLFEHGFNTRIIAPFTSSRCQRDAIKVAATDLGLSNQMNAYLKQIGFRWYHVLPRLVLQNPGLLFTKIYWEKTLFVRTYTMKHFNY
jgi:hypothetical protein